MMEASLKNKTVKGIGWSALDNICSYIVTFIVGVILARIISPDDYGLLGIISIFTAICSVIISAGFGTAIIRKKTPTDEDYNTAFICNIVLSFVLYFIIFLCAPQIANFFGRSELVSLARVSSLTMVVGAFSLVQQTRLTKRIDFKTQTKITLIVSINSGIVGISMAFLGYGVWALVAQSLTAQILRTALLCFFNKWIPSLHFSKTSFNELFGFGWKMTVSSILDSIWKELNQFIIGKFYTPASLGQYTRATGFSNMLSTNLSSVIQRVTYPVLSEMQDEKDRMVNAYRKIIKTTMFISFSASFALGAVSGPLVYCLIGPKWHEAATYLPLLCIIGAMYPLHAINLNMLQVQGRSDLFLCLEIIKKIIGLAPLFIGAFIGIPPMLYATMGIGLVNYFLNSYFPGKILGYNSLMQLRDISKSFFISLIMAVVVYSLSFLPMSNWVILFIQIVIGMIVFISLCKLTKSEEYEELKNLIIPVVRRSFTNNSRS